MISTTETFVADFRPLLRTYAVSPMVIDYFDAYKIPNKGYPAPTLNGNKAAYWIATPNDDDDVLPILALSLPESKRFVDLGYYWSIGAARTKDIMTRSEQLLQQQLSMHPVAAAVLEFAMAGPYVHREAFENIQLLCPMPKGIPRE